MSAFKAYDIRGIWGKELNEDICYRVGYFLPSLLSAEYVLVGRDIRLSSDDAHRALVQGIADSGADVWDMGLATTPMVYFATAFLDAPASVQITASHNPPEYNGLKISRKGALPVGGDSGLKELEALVNTGTIEKKASGKVKDISYIRDEYLSFLRSNLADISSLNISIDCSSGMSSLLVKDLFGTSPHYINDVFDGHFAAHEPNPLDVKNCRQIMAAVKENGSDIGIIYDGDADRVMFIDEKGRFIQPDYVTALLGLYYSRKGRKGNALVDIRTSKSTIEYLEAEGFPVTIWKVGHAFAKIKLREIDGVFGGELAGHYYFRDFFWCDSGIYASLLMLSVAAETKAAGSTLSALIDKIVCYSNSGEINFRLDDKDGAIEEIISHFTAEEQPEAILDFDGVRLSYPNWWLNVRKSNTEPYLRIVAEAESNELLEEKLAVIRTIISRHS